MARSSLALAFLLFGCVGAEKVNVTHFECLPMVTYSGAEQALAAKEMAALSPTAELAKMIVDYGKMRAADRACVASQ